MRIALLQTAVNTDVCLLHDSNCGEFLPSPFSYIPQMSFNSRVAAPFAALCMSGMGLNSSLSMADEIIGQASATRDMLMNQRGVRSLEQAN